MPSNSAGKLAAKLSLCLCAGQLLAGSLLVQQAEAAPVTTTVTPQISEHVDHRTITRGALVRVSVVIQDPRTGRRVSGGTVRLQARAGRTWRTWVSTKVSAQGVAVFRVRPGSSLQLRAVYGGRSHYRAVVSSRTQVTMVRPVTRGDRVLAEARRHAGALYRFGAAGPARFDCSGFTQYVYRKAVGTSLPHRANDQQRYGRSISRRNVQVGDLIIFRSGSYGYHAAIYAGGNYMYDSPHTGARVGKRKIFGGNYVVRRMV